VEVDDDKNVDQAKDKDASAGTAVGDQNAPLIDEQQSKVGLAWRSPFSSFFGFSTIATFLGSC
jgi:hypothetical protein